jgi:hypothetical protein
MSSAVDLYVIWAQTAPRRSSPLRPRRRAPSCSSCAWTSATSCRWCTTSTWGPPPSCSGANHREVPFESPSVTQRALSVTQYLGATAHSPGLPGKFATAGQRSAQNDHFAVSLCQGIWVGRVRGVQAGDVAICCDVEKINLRIPRGTISTTTEAPCDTTPGNTSQCTGLLGLVSRDPIQTDFFG